MILLLVVGVILLVLGYLLPAPHPIPLVLRILGWIAFGLGLLLLILGLLNGHATVDYDGMTTHLLRI